MRRGGDAAISRMRAVHFWRGRGRSMLWCARARGAAAAAGTIGTWLRTSSRQRAGAGRCTARFEASLLLATACRPHMQVAAYSAQTHREHDYQIKTHLLMVTQPVGSGW